MIRLYIYIQLVAMFVGGSKFADPKFTYTKNHARGGESANEYELRPTSGSENDYMKYGV